MRKRWKATSNVGLTVLLGFVLIAAGSAFALTHAPPRLLAASGPEPETTLTVTVSNGVVCQSDETLPAGVSAIRLSTWVFFGARVHVVVYSGSRVVTQGRRGPDWTGTSVTVPVTPVNHATPHTRVCLAIGPNDERVAIRGNYTPAREAAQIFKHGGPTGALNPNNELGISGRMTIEYLASGRRSWWSRILEVARRTGLGRPFSGTWIALLIAALTAAAALLAVGLATRELRRP